MYFFRGSDGLLKWLECLIWGTKFQSCFSIKWCVCVCIDRILLLFYEVCSSKRSFIEEFEGEVNVFNINARGKIRER